MFLSLETKKWAKFSFLIILPSLMTACAKKQFGSVNYDSITLEDCLALGIPVEECEPTAQQFKKVNQDVAVSSSSSVDVLFVVDNSPSMTEEQVGIGSKIGGFMDKIKDLNWQIAVTTTDPNGNTIAADGSIRSWGDGQFRPFDSDSGSQYILKSSEVSLSSAQSKLANAIKVGIKGTGLERGINAAYRAVQRSSVASYYQNGFFRNGASLAVIAISDEDECSTGPASGCPDKSSSVPQNFVNQVQSRLGASKVFSFHSIVHDSSCTSDGRNGTTYKQLSQLTGGQTGSICASDYTSILQLIGGSVADLVKSVTLSCEPQDLNNDGQVDLVIKNSQGTVLQNGFQVSGTTVTFNNALTAGNYNLEFYCADQ